MIDKIKQTHPDRQHMPVRGVDISARFHPDVLLNFEYSNFGQVVPYAFCRDLSADPLGSGLFSVGEKERRTCLFRLPHQSSKLWNAGVFLFLRLYAERGFMISRQSRSPLSSAVMMTSAVAMLVATGTL